MQQCCSAVLFYAPSNELDLHFACIDYPTINCETTTKIFREVSDG